MPPAVVPTTGLSWPKKTSISLNMLAYAIHLRIPQYQKVCSQFARLRFKMWGSPTFFHLKFYFITHISHFKLIMGTILILTYILYFTQVVYLVSHSFTWNEIFMSDNYRRNDLNCNNLHFRGELCCMNGCYFERVFHSSFWSHTSIRFKVIKLVLSSNLWESLLVFDLKTLK